MWTLLKKGISLGLMVGLLLLAGEGASVAAAAPPSQQELVGTWRGTFTFEIDKGKMSKPWPVTLEISADGNMKIDGLVQGLYGEMIPAVAKIAEGIGNSFFGSDGKSSTQSNNSVQDALNSISYADKSVDYHYGNGRLNVEDKLVCVVAITAKNSTSGGGQYYVTLDGQFPQGTIGSTASGTAHLKAGVEGKIQAFPSSFNWQVTKVANGPLVPGQNLTNNGSSPTDQGTIMGLGGIGLVPGALNATQGAVGIFVPALIGMLGALLSSWGDTTGSQLDPNSGDQNPPPIVPSGPPDGQTKTITGWGDGHDREIIYDAQKGVWIYSDTGGEYDAQKWDNYQKEMAGVNQWGKQDLDKMSHHDTAFDKETDAMLAAQKQQAATLAKLAQLDKDAVEQNLWNPGGPGDVKGEIDGLTTSVLAGNIVDKGELAKIKAVVKDRILSKTADETTLIDAYHETRNFSGQVNIAVEDTAIEVVAGEKSDGTTSYLGMTSRVLIGFETGGLSEYVFTPADAIIKVDQTISKAKPGQDSVLDEGLAIGGALVNHYMVSDLTHGVDTLLNMGVKRFPGLNKSVSEVVDDLTASGGEKSGVIGELPATSSKAQQLLQADKEYTAYINNAQSKVDNIANKVLSGGQLEEQEVTSLMGDPAGMRRLKGASDEVKLAYNDTLKSKVYAPTDQAVADQLKTEYGENVRLETVRTPDPEGNVPGPESINTDRDVRAVREVVGPDGQTVVQEIPKRKWERVYQQEFAKNTGALDSGGHFNLTQAQSRFPQTNWNSLSPQEQLEEWTKLHNQTPTDALHVEAPRDFSDQSTVMLGGKAPSESSTNLFLKGQGKLLDPEGLANVEKYKFSEPWNKGTVVQQTEALEQLGKMGDLTKKLNNGALNPQLEDALAIVKDRSLSPASRELALRNMGIQGGPAEVADHLAGWIKKVSMN